MDDLQKLTNALSNDTIPDRLRPPLPPNWGFATPTENCNLKFRANYSADRGIICMEGLWELTNALSNGTIRGPLWPPLPRNWGFATQIPSRPLISGTGKATDFKFGGYIYRANPNKSPLNFGERGAWTYPGTAQIFWVPPIISETGKATDFKFCRTIHRVDWNKIP